MNKSIEMAIIYVHFLSHQDYDDTFISNWFHFN